MGRKLKSTVTVKWLAKVIGSEYSGELGKIIRVDSAHEAGSHSLCFVKNRTWAQRAGADSVVIGSHDDLDGLQVEAIYSLNARLDFARILSALDVQVGFSWSELPPQIHPSARVGVNTVIANGVKIGADTVIGHNVVIGREVVIGERCNIKSGAVLGEEGFGFERDESGVAVRLPHIGTVIIGNDVEVGSLTTVCRGTLGNTIICDGVKIDDHVHIAHNIRVDEHAFIIACAEISGGVSIGKRAWIAPGSIILNQLSVGDDAVVGLGAVVVKSVESGVTVVGNPARPLKHHD
jgi:UDP-3-O-[3-hydroxymyristoyl] glucosamine N-acyltransferase